MEAAEWHAGGKRCTDGAQGVVSILPDDMTVIIGAVLPAQFLPQVCAAAAAAAAAAVGAFVQRGRQARLPAALHLPGEAALVACRAVSAWVQGSNPMPRGCVAHTFL